MNMCEWMDPNGTMNDKKKIILCNVESWNRCALETCKRASNTTCVWMHFEMVWKCHFEYSNGYIYIVFWKWEKVILMKFSYLSIEYNSNNIDVDDMWMSNGKCRIIGEKRALINSLSFGYGETRRKFIRNHRAHSIRFSYIKILLFDGLFEILWSVLNQKYLLSCSLYRLWMSLFL